jgi:hypothetical protein
MSISALELDDLYTQLCYGMSDKGSAAEADVLARLVLLLIHELDDPVRARRAIETALAGFADVTPRERPL